MPFQRSAGGLGGLDRAAARLGRARGGSGTTLSFAGLRTASRAE